MKVPLRGLLTNHDAQTGGSNQVARAVDGLECVVRSPKGENHGTRTGEARESHERPETNPCEG